MGISAAAVLGKLARLFHQFKDATPFQFGDEFAERAAQPANPGGQKIKRDLTR